MSKIEPIVLTVKIDVELPLWSAIKLRIAGADYVQEYVRQLLAKNEQVGK